MKRRDFFTTGAAALGAFSLTSVASADHPKSDGPKKDYLETRRYSIESPEKREKMEAFFAEAAIPAMKRQKAGPIGVFRYQEEDNNDLFVVIASPCPYLFMKLNRALLADDEFVKAAGPYLSDEKKDPLYARMESSLMISFDSVPKLEQPVKSPSRVFQLRTYEAHNVERATWKVNMFNEGGEAALFRKVGMNPVFFGEALIGQQLPNLTYMIGFENEEAKEAGWKAFLASPEWNAMKVLPQYKDTVSHIDNTMLTPADCSEV